MKGFEFDPLSLYGLKPISNDAPTTLVQSSYNRNLFYTKDEVDIKVGTKISDLSGFTTDDLTQGATNLYSQWTQEIGPGPSNYLTPTDSTNRMFIGDAAGANAVLGSLGTANIAGFVSNYSSGVGYFTNTAYNSSSSFFTLGGLFVGGLADGDPGAETTTTAGSLLAGLTGIAFDSDTGNQWIGGFLTGFYVGMDGAVTGGAFKPKLYLGGLGGNAMEATFNYAGVGLTGVKFNPQQANAPIEFYSNIGLALDIDGATGALTVGGTTLFNDSITIADAKDIILNTTTGTKWGTSTTQKQAWFNATPVVQQTSDVNALVTYGLLASISNITFTKEVSATIAPADTTTATTIGAALTIAGGKGKGVAVGGALNLNGGSADTGGVGGAVNIKGGQGENLSSGGNVSLESGNGFNGGSVLIDVGTGFTGGQIKIGSVRGALTAFGNLIATARVHITAGTTTVAPLKLNTGTNLTTAEVGAFEYDNTLYFTQSDATRRNVVLAASATKTTAGAPYTNDGYVTVRIGGTDVKLMTTA